MLISFLATGAYGEPQVPEAIRTTYAKYWKTSVMLLCGICIARVICLDILGALLDCMLATISIYITRHDCQYMSRHCVVLFGLLCFIQLTFEIMTLGLSIGGRKEQHSQKTTFFDASGARRTTYITSVAMHDFLDPSQHWTYNMQSVMLTLTPFVLLFATFVSYKTWQLFEPFSFALPDPEYAAYESGNLTGAMHFSESYGTPEGQERQSSQTGFFQGKGHKLLDAPEVQPSLVANGKSDVESSNADFGKVEESAVDNTRAPKVEETSQ